MKIIILAGGGGTRLFPLSRLDFPKQFLSLGSDDSLIALTLKRFLPLAGEKDIVIVTNRKHHRPMVNELQALGLPGVQVLAEPIGRNTLPAVCLGLSYLRGQGRLDEDEPIVVTPADHLISPQAAFLKQVGKAVRSLKEESLVTFGVTPSRPETGYGYIQCALHSGLFLPVKRFIEKPTLERARRLVRQAGCFWNSGIFAFTTRVFERALEDWQPALHVFFKKYSFPSARKRFASLPAVSIDYGIMEKTRNIACVPLTVNWSDAGTWDSIYDSHQKDRDRNVILGDARVIESSRSLFLSSSRLVAAVGVNDLIVAETADVVLVVGRGQSQKVKTLFEKMNDRVETRRSPQAFYPWGTKTTLCTEPGLTVYRLGIKPGKTYTDLVNQRRQISISFSGRARLVVNRRRVRLPLTGPLVLPTGSRFSLGNSRSTILWLTEIEQKT